MKTREQKNTRRSRATAADTTRILVIPLRHIRPCPTQPRKYFDPDRIHRLAESIKKRGQLTPGKVRRMPKGASHRWELVDGERRYRACQVAEIPTYRAYEVSIRDEIDGFVHQIIANEFQEKLEPIEEARAIRYLLTNGWDTESIAELFDKSVFWVTTRNYLCNLDPRVQALMDPSVDEDERLTPTIANALSPLPPDEQLRLAERAIAKDLTIKQVRHAIRQMAHQGIRREDVRGRKPHDDYKILHRFLTRTLEQLEILAPSDLGRLFQHRKGDDFRFMAKMLGTCVLKFADLMRRFDALAQTS